MPTETPRKNADASGIREASGHPWLVADVGGTNARFAWVAQPQGRAERIRKLAVAQYASPLEAARAYLESVKKDLGEAYRAPGQAAIAVATAVKGDRVELTNSQWSFSRAALQRDLGLAKLVVLNDFEALALSLPRLEPAQYRPWPGAAAPGRDAALAVIGPGTGLGVAAVVPTSAGWTPVPSEGGHSTLAPGNDFESALLARARAQCDHVSAERLLSGIGLPLLHQVVSEELGSPGPELATEDIVARGLAGGDAACGRTLEVFCAMLGSFAGSVALTFGARAGVFIGGGIVPRLGDRFFASGFRERFEAKGRFKPYLEAIPTALITDTMAALDGAVAALERR
ncbi:MAG: glucokinase [Betaproteobacteria bacterium]|nr:glucokinase [Betaproteobacteria bacterium]